MGDMSWGGAMDAEIEDNARLKAEITRLRARNEALEGVLGRIVREHGSVSCHLYEGAHAEKCPACIAAAALRGEGA